MIKGIKKGQLYDSTRGIRRRYMVKTVHGDSTVTLTAEHGFSKRIAQSTLKRGYKLV